MALAGNMVESGKTADDIKWVGGKTSSQLGAVRSSSRKSAWKPSGYQLVAQSNKS